MKKFLLIAALAAVALGANAEGYKIEKVWEVTGMESILPWADARQGIGMDGKFYINNKADQTIYVLDENGLTGTTYPGGANCGITCDEAGNLVVSNAAFPAAWVDATIKVISLKTREVKEYTVPEECGILGRSDFIGFAKGDLMENGVLYFTGATNDGVCVLTITNGEVDFDNSYNATCDGLTKDNMTVINHFYDVDGNEALLYVYRSMSTNVRKLTAEGDGFVSTTISLPGKGACNGTFPFTFDNKQMFLYPITPNYLNGFAIAEGGAEEPIVSIEATVAANPNTCQANWLNAEVDRSGVTIYQYAPGSNITVYRMTKEEEPVPPTVYILGEVNEQGWAANAGTEMTYDPENNVYTANVTLDGRGEAGENYFSFTTELANDNDDGGWAYIAPFRFGAVAEGDFWYDDMYDGQPLGLTYENGQAFRVLAGEYNLTVSLENMTLVIKKVVPPYVRGDVDGDQVVNISDVTALIDYLLSGATAPAAADCDLDQNVNISDVTALIDFLLSGHWAE